MLDGGGLTNFHFLWRSSVHVFGDKAQALQFLGRFRGNPAYMAKLRSLVAQRGAWPIFRGLRTIGSWSRRPCCWSPGNS